MLISFYEYKRPNQDCLPGSWVQKPDLRVEPCQYDSCEALSGSVGYNHSRPELNWVNSHPVTAMQYGIDTIGPRIWHGEAPELAVVGPNVGSLLWTAIRFAGNVCAAASAAMENIPAIAFSGDSEGRLPWNTEPVPNRSLVYAELATILTNEIIKSGKPYLPEGVFLNVNFPNVKGKCQSASDFKFVMSRINPAFPLFSKKDVDWCGSKRLPTEWNVLKHGHCQISVSVGDMTDLTTASAKQQKVVLESLKDILHCHRH